MPTNPYMLYDPDLDTWARWNKLNLENVCSVLGYEKGSSTRDSTALKKETRDFLEEYEYRGHKVPPNNRASPVEARLCAAAFLEEERRGERLFPPNLNGYVIWPDDRDTISEGVAQIFRYRAYNNKQLDDAKRRKHERDAEAELEFPIKEEAQVVPRRSFSRTAQSRSQQEGVAEWHRGNTNNFIGLDPAHHLKPWLEDSERFNRPAAIRHVKDLAPYRCMNVITEFTHEWLSQGNNCKWPEAADPIVSYFMHQRNFYFSDDLKHGIYREVVDKLRKGTELDHSLNRPQYTKLEKRVGDRITHLTNEFIGHCFLEKRSDESVAKTRRFQQLWDSREEHWRVDREATSPDDIHRPKKRRKITKPHIPKSPITFPNITQRSQHAMPQESLQALAGSALKEIDDETFVLVTPQVVPLNHPPEIDVSISDPEQELSSDSFSLDQNSRKSPENTTVRTDLGKAISRASISPSAVYPNAEKSQGPGGNSAQCEESLRLFSQTPTEPSRTEIHREVTISSATSASDSSSSPFSPACTSPANVKAPTKIFSPEHDILRTNERPQSITSTYNLPALSIGGADNKNIQNENNKSLESNGEVYLRKNNPFVLNCERSAFREINKTISGIAMNPDSLRKAISKVTEMGNITRESPTESVSAMSGEAVTQALRSSRGAGQLPMNASQHMSTTEYVPNSNNYPATIRDRCRQSLHPSQFQRLEQDSQLVHQLATTEGIPSFTYKADFLAFLGQHQIPINVYRYWEHTQIAEKGIKFPNNCAHVDQPEHTTTIPKSTNEITQGFITSAKFPDSQKPAQKVAAIPMTKHGIQSNQSGRPVHYHGQHYPNPTDSSRHLLSSSWPSQEGVKFARTADTSSHALPQGVSTPREVGTVIDKNSSVPHEASPPKQQMTQYLPSRISEHASGGWKNATNTPKPQTSAHLSPVPEPITPSQTPSPTALTGPSRRPYAFIPPPSSFSTLPSKPPPPSTDLIPHPRQHSPPPLNQHPSAQPVLEFIFHLANNDLDVEHPIPFCTIAKLSLSSFFEVVSQRSGINFGELQAVSVSPVFYNKQSFEVGRGNEEEWEEVKETLQSMFHKKVKNGPEKKHFRIWVDAE